MRYTKKQKNLALKWARGKISHADVQRTIKKTPMGTYVALALMLREVINENQYEN
jgi:hypothetical protein